MITFSKKSIHPIIIGFHYLGVMILTEFGKRLFALAHNFLFKGKYLLENTCTLLVEKDSDIAVVTNIASF